MTPACLYWCCILDNVFAIKTWVKNKLAVEEAVIDKQFDIPETFDYVEWMIQLMQLTVAFHVTKFLAVYLLLLFAGWLLLTTY